MKNQSSSELQFDPEKHQYWIGKKRIPGVSEILQKVGLSKSYEGVDSFYRDRGIACHKAIELYLKGILDQSSLDPAVKPCFDAFLAFWDGRKEPILALEKPMTNPSYEFAGTPDLITPMALYDWKCSKSHDKVADLQGQAYKILALTNGLTAHNDALDRYLGIQPFIVVELHDDGTFKEFNYGNSYAEWDSAMTLYLWKTK